MCCINCLEFFALERSKVWLSFVKSPRLCKVLSYFRLMFLPPAAAHCYLGPKLLSPSQSWHRVMSSDMVTRAESWSLFSVSFREGAQKLRINERNWQKMRWLVVYVSGIRVAPWPRAWQEKIRLETKLGKRTKRLPRTWHHDQSIWKLPVWISRPETI